MRVCKLCGYRLSAEDEFCPYCGADPEDIETTGQEQEAETVSARPSRAESSEWVGIADRMPPTQHEKTGRNNDRTAALVLAITVGVLLIANVFQYFSGRERYRQLLQRTYAEAEDAQTEEGNVASLQELLAGQKQLLNEQQKKILELEPLAENYREICETTSEGTLGYASKNFRVNVSVLALKMNETNRKFTLTADWGKDVTVSVAYSHPVANLVFGEHKSSGAIQMSATPLKPGLATATFTNNLNDESFQILILVTE